MNETAKIHWNSSLLSNSVGKKFEEIPITK